MPFKTPKTYFEDLLCDEADNEESSDQPDFKSNRSARLAKRKTDSNFEMMSQDAWEMHDSFEEKLIPSLGVQGRHPASKRLATEENQGSPYSVRSQPRYDPRKDSLKRMVSDKKKSNANYTGRSRLDSKLMKVKPKDDLDL